MVKFSKALITTAVALGISASASAMDIGYITKSATNSGWIMINSGAADAAKEAGANLVTVGPAFQGDLSSQLEVFENLVSQGIDAIGVAPVDSSGIAPAVQAAMDAGIPVVAIDTGVNGADVTSFVATDNFAVATIQGQEAANLVADGDKIIYVTGNQAQAGVEALLNRHDDVKMVVNAWDGGTMGAKAALENLGYSAGDVKLVGFDGAVDAIEAMDNGWVHVDTAQMLYQMGYQGIKAAIAAANGQSVEARIDTGTFLVTPETSAEYKALIGM